MSSSQEKTEKWFSFIEKTVAEQISKENNEIIFNEYLDILLNELKIHECEEKILQESFDEIQKIEDSVLNGKYVELQEKVFNSEKLLYELREEIDNVTIQSTADKETLRIQYAEKNQQIALCHKNEKELLMKQLEKNCKEHNEKEKRIKDDISLEIFTKAIKLDDLTTQLQRQIVELNGTLTKAQNEHKNLQKELNSLKNQQKFGDSNSKNTKTNVMEFHNNHIFQEKPNYFSEPISALNDRSSSVVTHISEENNEMQNTGNNNLIPNSFNNEEPNQYEKANVSKNGSKNNFTKSQQCKNNFSNNFTNKNHQWDSSYFQPNIDNTLETNQPFTKATNIQSNISAYEQLNETEISYYASEYDQFNNTDDQLSTVDFDDVNIKMANLVPNPCSFVGKTGINANKNQDKYILNNYLGCVDNTVKSPGSVGYDTNKRPKINNNIGSVKAMDRGIQFDDSIKISDSFDCMSSDGAADVESVTRKVPTVYVGEKKKVGGYKRVAVQQNKAIGEWREGTTLGKISGELWAKKKK